MNHTKNKRKPLKIITGIFSLLLIIMLLLAGSLYLPALKLKKELRNNYTITVIVNSQFSDTLLNSINSKIKSKKYVREIFVPSAKKVESEINSESGEDFIATLGFNPIHQNIKIKLMKNYIHKDSISMIEADLKELDGIKEVYIPPLP